MRALLVFALLALSVPPAVVLSVAVVASLRMTAPPDPLPVWRFRCAR